MRPGKLSLPGRKQVFRAINPDGSFYADLIGLANEDGAMVAREFNPTFRVASSLLETQFTAGHRLGHGQTLAESRDRLRESMASLAPRYKDLQNPEKYPVAHTMALDATLAAEKIRVAGCQD